MNCVSTAIAIAAEGLTASRILLL